jgi:hypothetical protein
VSEVGGPLAFAQILLTQHFRLFQHNRPEAVVSKCGKSRRESATN